MLVTSRDNKQCGPEMRYHDEWLCEHCELHDLYRDFRRDLFMAKTFTHLLLSLVRFSPTLSGRERHLKVVMQSGWLLSGQVISSHVLFTILKTQGSFAPESEICNTYRGKKV